MERKNRYSTKQRVEIYNLLKENKEKFFSALELKEYVDSLGLSIGLTTIYRFLNELEEEKQVKSEYIDGMKCYKYIPKECNLHAHLKCIKCGKLIHLECEEFEELKVHIFKEHDFKINSNVTIHGVCKDCE